MDENEPGMRSSRFSSFTCTWGAKGPRRASLGVAGQLLGTAVEVGRRHAQPGAHIPVCDACNVMRIRQRLQQLREADPRILFRVGFALYDCVEQLPAGQVLLPSGDSGCDRSCPERWAHSTRRQTWGTAPWPGKCSPGRSTTDGTAPRSGGVAPAAQQPRGLQHAGKLPGSPALLSPD